MTARNIKRQHKVRAKLKRWIVLCAMATLLPAGAYAHTDHTTVERQQTYSMAKMILDGNSGQPTDNKSAHERMVGMYAYLGERGYAYGKLAGDIARNEGFSGVSFNRYMTERSLILRDGKKINGQGQLKLAQRYLKILQENIENNTFKDIDWKNASDLHSQALLEDGVDPLYWPMTLPFAIHDDGQNTMLWNGILRAAGQTNLEMGASADLYLKVTSDRILVLEKQVAAGELAPNDPSISKAYQQSRAAVTWQSSMGLMGKGLKPGGSLLGDPFSISVPALGALWSESRINRMMSNLTNANSEFSAVVLDLNRDDVVSSITPNAYTKFDHHGDGFAEQGGWVEPADGVLVLDRNGNGAVDSGNELFGNYTVLGNGNQAAHGFSALAELDSNADKVLDENDTAFSSLRIWQDSNANGAVERGELKTLEEVGVKSINLTFTSSNQTDASGNIHKQHSRFTRTDGSEGKVAGVWFKGNTANTQERSFVAVGAEIMTLPDVLGMGTTHSLWQAMARDESGQLKARVSQFGEETDFDTRKAMVQQIVFQWTGAHTYAENSRGSNIDGRIVYALEALSGRKLTQNPGTTEANNMLLAFNQVSQYVYGQLILQTHYAEQFGLTKINFNVKTGGMQVAGLVSQWRQMYASNPAETQKTMRDFALSVRHGISDGLADHPLLTALRKAGNPKGNEFDMLLSTLGGGEMIIGTNGADTLKGTTDPDVILGRAGHDQIYGGAGDDELHGEDGSDSLYGEQGNDRLYGGDGNDYLYAGNSGTHDNSTYAGENWLEGGAGNDQLYGTYGNTTYYFERGWGVDTVNNYNAYVTVAPRGVIQFGEGISPEDIRVLRNNKDLILNLRGSADKITVNNYFEADATKSYTVKEVQFADGTVWDTVKIKELMVLGSDNDDTLYGHDGKDVIHGLGGNDRIYGQPGDDELYGEDEGDYLYGELGNDRLYGGEGNDYLYSGSHPSHDYTEFVGENWLEGGAGNDYLYGTYGNTTYYFERGWGTDTVNNYNAYVTAAPRGVIQFGEGISPEDIQLTRNTTDLYLSLKGSTDKITVSNYFYLDATGSYAVKEIQLADGTIWDVDTVKHMVRQGTEGSDYLYGYATDDELHGLGGNDYLYGYGGKDTLHGDSGNDRIYGGAGDDELYGEDGDDWLYGEQGNDRLYGGDGNDYLYAGNSGTHDNSTYAGENWLEGGAGNDQLYGTYGNTTYYFERGWGTDTVNNYNAYVTAAPRGVIQFGEGISPEDIQLTRNTTDLYLSLKGSTDKITVSNYFYLDATGSYAVKEIQLADGTIWDVDTVKHMVRQGTEGSDYLYGYATDDELHGLGGNDYLYGYGGKDTLHGDSGNDRIYGGAGDDELYGEDGDDWLYGEQGNDRLYGGDGNDYLYAGNSGTHDNSTYAGENWLEGGAGNDQLYGTYGNTTYYFERGWGTDTVNNYNAYVTAAPRGVIQFGEGISPEDIQLTRNTTDLYLSLKGSTDKITVSNYFYLDATGSYAVKEIQLADGTIWDVDTVKHMVRQGTEGSDYLYGYATDDELHGLGGNDYLYGYGGKDTLHGDSGNDRIYGGAGDDELYGEDGDDWLYGEQGNDRLYGGDGNDYLYAGNSGTHDNSTYAGENWLEGGAGNDQLYGTYGNTTYYFERGWGTDTVNNYNAYVTAAPRGVIQFGEGISPEDIQLTRNTTDLYLSLKGSTDKITVNYYFYQDATTSYTVKEVRFADGTVWNVDTIKDMVLLGTNGNDILYGHDGDDELYGYGGNDTLYGRTGSDRLYGGDGNDYLYAGNSGTHDNSTYAGENWLEGGGGNDQLYGTYGNTTYYFERGWGVDTISNYNAYVEKAPRGVIQFSEDISPEDIRLTRDPSHLYLWLKGSTDKITVSSYFTSDATTSYTVKEVRFADGTIWDVDKVKALVILGTDGNDTLYGSAHNEVIRGGAGNDQIYGGAGDDELYGEDGNDWLYGELGNDRLYGGDGNDYLYAGNSGTHDNSTYAGENWLEGGAGNDQLYGTYGNTTYYFERGWGTDTVNNYNAYVTAAPRGVIQFGEGISPEDIQLTRSTTDLYLSLKGSTDKITVNYYFYQDATTSYTVKEVRFADGTIWDVTKVKALVTTN